MKLQSSFTMALFGAGFFTTAALAQSTGETILSASEAYAPALSRGASRRDEIPSTFSVAAPDVVELGWGWSDQRAEPIPTSCIEFSEGEGAAQTSNITIKEVSDSYTLSKALDVSASASIRAFGAKVDGKASMVKNSKVSTMSVTYVVRAEVLNDSKYVAPPDAQETDRLRLSGGKTSASTVDVQPVSAEGDASKDVDALGVGSRGSVGSAVRLTDNAVHLARTDKSAFRRICGDGYVSASVTGARAYLVSVIKTTSKSQRQTVKASVTGEGWGQKVSAAAKSSSEEAQDNIERDLTFFQEGGSAVPSQPVSVDGEVQSASDLPKDANEAIARIQKLANAARDAGKIFEISISPYEALENYPSRAERESDTDEHEELAGLMGAFSTLYDDLAIAMSQPAGYAVPLRQCADTCTVALTPMTAPDAFAAAEIAQDMVLAALAQLEEEAARCFADGDECEIDVGSVRSPFAIYTNAPMPVDSSSTIADHTSIFMRDVSAGRCQLGVSTQGCITNAMINAWKTRKGLISVSTPDVQRTMTSIAACETLDQYAVPGDANNSSLSAVWVNPLVKLSSDGSVICPPA